MKQFREMGRTSCLYGSELVFSTLLFAIAQGDRGERTFGLKVEHSTSDGIEESCLVDFDELKELLLAIRHLLELAKQNKSFSKDYTEYEYITKDSLHVGFYQDSKGKQQAYFDVSPNGETTFLGFDTLREIFNIIMKGRDHLIQLGAGAEAVESEQTD